jgi:hypothetical protein
VKAFACRVCGSRLFFENSVCVTCGTGLGFSRGEADIVPVDAAGRYVDAAGLVWHVCRNLALTGCTWLAPLEGGQCAACDLTRTRPNDADAAGLAYLVDAERAKRYLVFELDRLGVPVVPKSADAIDGLCFDLLSSETAPVVTGHDDGVVTIDLAEADDAHRESVRAQLGETYRTMLGHLRHEVGHYIQWRFLRDDDLVARSRELFGDERADYGEALDRHYADGAPAGWEASFISAYATMHPFEDFAETWAHFLHICDSVETARAYALAAVGDIRSAPRFSEVVRLIWMPLATALNMMNRAMGKHDLYPFVIPEPVLDKLDLIAQLQHRVAAGGVED